MSEKPDPNDDEEEQAWSDAWSDDYDGDDGASPAEPPPASDEPDPESVPPELASSEPQEPEPEETVDSLKHKLRSAEGRFNKFEEHIDGLKQQISKLTPDEPKAPQEEPLLPQGWSQEDWDDFSADYPAQAELLEQQSRQVKTLTERVDNTENHLSVTEQNRIFNDAIHAAHPDYDDLLNNERQQITNFIAGQKNTTLKTAYEQIYQGGSAEQIIELVNDYKATGRTSGTDKSPPVNKQSNIDNALAVPGRSRSPRNIAGKSGIPDEDDFSGGWNYFSDDSIDD